MYLRRKILIIHVLFFIFCLYVLVRYHDLETFPQWQQLTRERVVYLMNEGDRWVHEAITLRSKLVYITMNFLNVFLLCYEDQVFKKAKAFTKSKRLWIVIGIWIVAIGAIVGISRLNVYMVYMDMVPALAFALTTFIFFNSPEVNTFRS
ncbi:hypothetical protein O6R05_06145 [Peptoniphilus equinus]|uniref:Uncharacterized protein n=1 Tax=Peptoniphilus equinus TaxID=3016343 RepID=A0ABY7QTH3_9FIRM|nr:hypothetical protein [Peptoniphilus equinus]WBW49575.1 hypothetical protein O6R05_06145 [Peptoniphilus equinus]